MTSKASKISDHTQLKTLSLRQIFQRFPIALAQAKADKISKNLLNEICQIIYSLYRAKEITRKEYNNSMNSIKLQNRIETMFMNSKKSKTSYPYRLLLNLSNRINLSRSNKYIALSNLSINYTRKNMKNSYKINKFKISAPTWFNLMNLIKVFQITEQTLCL